MWPAVAAAIAAPIIGGVIGGKAAQGAQDAANRMSDDRMAMLNAISIPDLKEIAYELDQSQGLITPEGEIAAQVGPSELAGISTDPRLQAAAMNQLESLQSEGRTPLSAEEQAQLNQMRRQTAQGVQAQKASILQEMAQRGTAGSGQELVAKQMAAQAAAERESQESDRLASMMQQRKLAAQEAAGQLARGMQEQEFGQKAQVASAEDVANRINTEFSAATQQRNVGARNVAQAENLAAKTRLGEMQTATRNKQRSQGNEFAKSKFDMEMAKASGMSSAMGDKARSFADEAAGTRSMWGSIGSGVGSAFGSIAASGSKPTVGKKPIV